MVASALAMVLIDNFVNGEEVEYPLVLVEGRAAVPKSGRLEVLVDGKENGSVHWSDGRFKAVVMLQPGQNDIEVALSRGGARALLRIAYREILNPKRFIRMVYLLSSDGDGTIQAPEDEGYDVSMEATLLRVMLAGRLIQTSTAELLYRQFRGESRHRRTFAMSNEVYVHRSKKSTAEMYDLDGDGGYSLWSFVNNELDDTVPDGYDRDSVIDVVIMSFSRFIEKEERVRGHTALGGGQLGLFGSASCFSWPQDVSSIQPCFLDDRTFNPRKILDDGLRTRCWALSATTIGAVLHETGHCLDLPHVRHIAGRRGGGIMNRGFDHLNRLFVTTERNEIIIPDDEPFWDRPAALRLFWHTYIAGLTDCSISNTGGLCVVALQEDNCSDSTEEPQPTPRPAPVQIVGSDDTQNSSIALLSLDSRDQPVIIDGDQIVVFSSNGLRQLTYLVNGDGANHEEYSPPLPQCIVVARGAALLRSGCKGDGQDELKVSAIDAFGSETSHVLIEACN